MKKIFDKICKECGKKFVARNVKKIYCSGKCRQKNYANKNRREYNKICIWCKKDFVSIKHGTKLCSPVCVGKYKNKIGIGVMHECDVCKSKFLKKHKRHRFCSNECKSKYNNKRVPMTTVLCTNCQAEILRPRKLAKKKRNFYCKKQCETDYRVKNSSENRTCEVCKKRYKTKKTSKQRFCSVKCQSKWQKTIVGKNHRAYKHEVSEEFRIKKCECCGVDIVCTPKEFKHRKYCSLSCKAKSQPRANTKPHVAISNLLKGIVDSAEDEVQFGRYVVDCYLGAGLCIEVMGEYWHCDIRKYDKPVDDIQRGIIPKDTRKKRFLVSNSKKILYLWEMDIYHKLDMCEKLIIEFLERNGKLKNYHSINYDIKNEKLVLRNEILIPHFEKK